MERRARLLSPDGRWLLFESDETGRPEIYVTPFPGPGRTFPVSTDGGRNPDWRGDGREVVYGALDGRVLAAPAFPEGDTFRVGAAAELFRTVPPQRDYREWGMSRDGAALRDRPARRPRGEERAPADRELAGAEWRSEAAEPSRAGARARALPRSPPRIGAGGMGEVYRATDTKLGRDVAIKVLPAELAQDPERLARFEREAKLLASLNHPNIAHVYGFESATLADGSAGHFLAMELVEGEDLAERLKRGPIPVDEALAIARQIAEALEEAHEKGIVHRDLKPANVKLDARRQGQGARLRPRQGLRGRRGLRARRPDLSQSPTLAHTGTAGRASSSAPPPTCRPSRRAARPVDKRADIWAFGVVLYEMLTGAAAVRGRDGLRRSWPPCSRTSRTGRPCRRRCRPRSRASCAAAW